MRTSRLPALLTVAAALAAPSLASAANCYSIYDAKNRLAFQSTVSPIDLSTRISQAMRQQYPGGFLVMIPDDADCREFRTGPVVSPRFDAGKAPEVSDETMQAPLLRGAQSSPTGSETAPTRETIRSGNTLSIRKP